MSLLGDIQTLIVEHGSASILRERLLLIQDQAKVLEKQVEELQGKVSALEQANRQLQGQLAAKSSAEEFVEHRGALFKRKSDGTYHLAVYCPICHKPTGGLSPSFPISCTDQCGWIGTFQVKDIPKMIEELPK